MTDKPIPLVAVRNALMLAKVKKLSTRTIGRFAAYTQYPSPFGTTCRDALRGRGRLPVLNLSFGPMSRGDFEGLIARVRREHGLSEIRKIWHTGMRALQAELVQGTWQ
ncbi:hypothetical protein [Ramlibacter sp.]|uniref:hypothetical protein n=1 Tax=Ramlibacter sp. TaxID=1917967 RepID=UPI003D0B5B38